MLNLLDILKPLAHADNGYEQFIIFVNEKSNSGKTTYANKIVKDWNQNIDNKEMQLLEKSNSTFSIFKKLVNNKNNIVIDADLYKIADCKDYVKYLKNE